MPELSSTPVGGFHEISVLFLSGSAGLVMLSGHIIVGGLLSLEDDRK